MQTITKSRRWLGVGGVGLLLLLMAGIVLASGGLELPRAHLTGGGGQVSSSGLVLSSAVGQPVAGTVTNGSMQLCTGFWCGEGASVPPPGDGKTYLPMVIRGD
ncbi:MAG: hypothetical protein KJ063_23445 [Anaerolineae bacterium]|nr:hypothetical protein [Anaerolineae bacterium]